MKTLHLLLASFLLMMTSCNGQPKKNPDNLFAGHAPGHAINDSLPKPDIRYKVNKKLDEKGRVISYDSTYTYTYSGKKGDSYTMQSQHALKSFNQAFGSPDPAFFNFSDVSPFLNDTLFKTQFDYNSFEQRMERNKKMMMELFDQMDAEHKKHVYEGQQQNSSRKEI